MPALADATRLPPALRAALDEAAAHIADWTPKGVHFAWTASFRNKGKFPAAMTKDEARLLVTAVLRRDDLAVLPNVRDGRPAPGEYRLIAEMGTVIGSRGQRRLRIVLVPTPAGYRVDNAFPVHVR